MRMNKMEKFNGMTYFQEKIVFGGATFLSSAISGLGAILTVGEARWVYITLCMSIITASFLSLLFKRLDESVRVVIGRCGISILLGIFGTRALFHYYDLTLANDDSLILGGLSCLVTTVGFFIGYEILGILNSESRSITQRLVDWFAKKMNTHNG